MTPRLDVRVGELLDQAVRLEAQALALDGTVADLERAIASLQANTDGEASAAAVTSSQNALAEATLRADRLQRNADTLRRLAEVYDTCDLSAARALGS
jgi:uncharacterized protein YukE